MEYARHYDRMIARARARKLPGYAERHHVLPRCLGGSDEASNLVWLTAEEHFVAHQLLVRMHPGHVGLTWAAVNMRGGNRWQGPRMTNRLYGWLRRAHAGAARAAGRTRTHTLETRAKMAAAKAGTKREARSPETRARIASACRGREKTPEHRVAAGMASGAARMGVKRGPYNTKKKD